MWPKFGNSSISMKEVIITSILYGKNTFFDEWSWFRFNNLGLALALALKFYTSVTKVLKLKARKFCGLIPTFVEVTRGKLVGGPFLLPPLPPSWIGLRLFYIFKIGTKNIFLSERFTAKCKFKDQDFKHCLEICNSLQI